MKKHFLSISAVVLLAACSGDKAGPQKDSTADSGSNGTPQAFIGESLILEDVCTLKDVKEAAERYGAENVTRDTIWGEEGTFFMGTKLFPGTNKQVEISWSDSIHFSGMLSATVRAGRDSADKPVVMSPWKSKTGIRLGTSLRELETLNGKPFVLFGFGWDFGGMLQSWNKGKLENAQVFVSLDKPEAWNYGGALGKLYSKFQGDYMFKSDTLGMHELNPVVMEMTVTPPKK